MDQPEKEKEQPVIPEAHLIGMKGLFSDLEFRILADTIYIGRVSGNDIVLNDTSVSSQHAKISWENQNFIIADLDSKNGITVNGKAVSKKLLKNGDRIKVGGTTFRFVYKPPSREVPGADRPASSESGTNPVRKAIYGIGIFIILVIFLKLFPSPVQHEQDQPKNVETEIYVTMQSLDEKMSSESLSATGDKLQEADNYYKRGIIYYDSRQYRQAITEYLKARSLRESDGVYESALTRALDQLNKEIDYHVRLGKFHADHLRYADAIKEWEYALFLIEDTKLPQYTRIQSSIGAVRERLEAHAPDRQ